MMIGMDDPGAVGRRGLTCVGLIFENLWPAHRAVVGSGAGMNTIGAEIRVSR